jgi:hypothetical protein
MLTTDRTPRVIRGWRTHDSPAPPRRRPDELAEIIEAILPPAADRCVFIGPVVSGADAGREVPRFYFAVVSNDGEAFSVIVGARTIAEADDLRERVRLRLLGHWKRPILHQFEDEAEMARWAERTWPDDPVAATIRREIEVERKRN